MFMHLQLKKIKVVNVNDVEKVADTVDFVFSAVDMSKDEIKAIEEAYARTETPVVSNNSAHRWTQDVPMVVPELNAGHIQIIDAQRQRQPLLEALALKEYGKVYLSLGVNELGYSSKNDSSFYRHYCEAIDAIRRVQPNAVIYVQTLIPVNEKQVEEYNGNKYNLTNDRLRTYNDLIRQAAEEKQVVCLDLYSLFVDENGSLPEGDSRDGVHLRKEPCQRWLDYLKTHTADFDALYPDGPPAVETQGTANADGSGQG